MENQAPELPFEDTQTTGKISQSFMNANYPKEEEAPQTEVANEPQQEVVDTPVQEDVIELNPTPEATPEVAPEPTLEVVEESTPPPTRPEPTKYEIEGLNKLAEFMQETGGTMQDYINLNKDYSEYDNKTLLTEYYKSTKPHYDSDDIQFLVDNKLDIDEELLEGSELRAKIDSTKRRVISSKAGT